jgi:uncharacterized repeat protein (TIGR03833 family)
LIQTHNFLMAPPQGNRALMALANCLWSDSYSCQTQPCVSPLGWLCDGNNAPIPVYGMLSDQGMSLRVVIWKFPWALASLGHSMLTVLCSAVAYRGESPMDGQQRNDIRPGMHVEVILKKDQRTGKRTAGVVKDILTSAAYHSRGIKVRLNDGQVGRVQGILADQQ